MLVLFRKILQAVCRQVSLGDHFLQVGLVVLVVPVFRLYQEVLLVPYHQNLLEVQVVPPYQCIQERLVVLGILVLPSGLVDHLSPADQDLLSCPTFH
mmetsp:Transcript_34518/g.55195  ORF Transcript_34518/g.55195 Transcript_34518/m.55195 type:complete len:97 (+) Transcript_34518:1028-1318(+)